jgi:hypothetical protein
MIYLKIHTHELQAQLYAKQWSQVGALVFFELIKPRERPTHWLDNYVQTQLKGGSSRSMFTICFGDIERRSYEELLFNGLENKKLEQLLNLVECKT